MKNDSYSKKLLMSVLPAGLAHRFRARLGEPLDQGKARPLERSDRSTGAPAASDHVIAANFDEAGRCAEISYAKEDGSRFTAEEIAALFTANSADGRRKWTQTSKAQWRSDDGFMAELGATKLSATNHYYYWLHFHGSPGADPASKTVAALEERVMVRSALQQTDSAIKPAAPKPPATFRQAGLGGASFGLSPVTRAGADFQRRVRLWQLSVIVVCVALLTCSTGRSRRGR